jgi:hypothetical protein
MRDIPIKVDGVDTLAADDWNAQNSERENAVNSVGLTLDPAGGPDTDLNMLSKTMAGYANAANVYTDSGAADAYVLAIATLIKTVNKYHDNMSVFFKVGNTNTGASTVNVAGLGIKSITFPDGTALVAGALTADTYARLIYSLSNDRFELHPVVQAANGLIRDSARGLIVEAASVSAIDIDADELALHDSAGLAPYKATSVNLTADITASGANGLDTGSEAAGTNYYAFAIYNPGTDTLAGLISLSKTAPTMPAGYTHKALVGEFFNDGGSDISYVNQWNGQWFEGGVVSNAQTGSGTLAASPGTTVFSLEAGIVSVGDIIEVEGYILALKGGTAGPSSIRIEKAGGAGVLVFYEDSLKTTVQYYVDASQTWSAAISAKAYITGAGNLTIKIIGISDGSTSSLASGTVQMKLRFIKKQ